MWKTTIAIAAAALSTAGALLVIAQTTTQRDQRQQDINRVVCQAVVKLDGAISDSLRRTLTALPKIAYYKEHPQELAVQLADTRETLSEFVPPVECVHSSPK
jgi:hypothetical protein